MTGFIPFKEQDVFLLNLREFDQKRREASEDWMLAFMQAKYSGTCWTLVINDRIAAIAGCIPLRKGVIEVFTATDKMVVKHAKTLVKHGRDFIGQMIEIYDPHRIQSVVHGADERSIRWNQALGLEVECYMRGYGEDGSNHFMCVREVK